MTVGQKLNFVAVGPQRTATSWLDQCLRFHPQLRLPDGTKETFYWDVNYHLPSQWYWSHFSGVGEGQLLGEVGSTYFHCARFPEVLREHNSDCKIVFTLRSPRARVVSLWRHLKRVGLVSDDRPFSAEDEAMFSVNYYESNLERWYSFFPECQILIIITEDIESKPEAIIAQITDFLGVDHHEFPNLMERVNEGEVARYQWLSNLLYSTARVARRYRFHSVVEIVKKLGIRKYIASNKNSCEVPENRSAIVNRSSGEYDSDILYVEKLLKRNLDVWRV